MSKKYDITHPLLTEPGSSQRKRADDLLNNTVIKIDDHELIDRLHFIYRFSKQVNFREYILDADNGDYTVESDWQQFFEYSTPFVLANIAYFDTASLSQQFETLRCEYLKQQSHENLRRLFEFCFGQIIMPLFYWYAAFQDEEKLFLETVGMPAEGEPKGLAFKQQLADIIQSNLAKDLTAFIQIYNQARVQACLGALNFFPFFSQGIWGLQITDLGSVASQSDPELWVQTLGEISSKFLQIVEQLGNLAPTHVKDALVPVQKMYRERHQPHLGLLFAFLELFEYVQNDLNRLSTEHLEFFFKRALRIKAKAGKPDQTHLVFEMAKHLEQYLVTQGKAFKDGKDLLGKDVIFHLDEEVVLDKAKVESLQTLFLHFEDGKINKYDNCPPSPGQKTNTTFHSYIHGVHMAPVANSADGVGAAFPENQTANWPTMGAETTKLNAPGKEKAGKMQHARIGFVMASPVLLLQEGQREIKFEIDCKTADNLGFTALCGIEEAVEKALTQKYYLLKNDLFFRLDDFFALEDTLFKVENQAEIKAFITRESHGFLQKLWISCNLNFEKINPANFPTGLALFEIYQKIAQPISEAGRTYLMGLLAKQNPYPFGYNLDDCLDVALEPSCKPLFDCCEKLLLRFLLDTEARENCYLPKHFFNAENRRCVPFTDQRIFEDISSHFANYNGPTSTFHQLWLDQPFMLGLLPTMILNPEKKEDPCKQEFIRLHCASESLFNISLSTEEGWYVPKRVKTEFEIKPDTQKFIFTITLDETEPPITFFDPEALKEDFKLDKPYPAAKLELNGDLKVRYYGAGEFNLEDLKPGECPVWDELCWTACPDLQFKKRTFIPTPNEGISEYCCLERPAGELPALLSLYEIFRDIEIQDTKIDVTVCGVKKNIIVQNDENVQDINAPIYPFGVRPNVPASGVLNNQLTPDDPSIPDRCANSGTQLSTYPNCPDKPETPDKNLIGPNFYIGSQEILKKKWKSICVHLNWKDKPADFHHYYAAYGNVYECDFEINLSVLEQGAWKREICKRNAPTALIPHNPFLKLRNPDIDTDCTTASIHPVTRHYNRELFKHKGHSCACECPEGLPPAYGKPFPYEQTIKVDNQYFPLNKEDDKNICEKLERLYPYSRDGFLRLSLENQDFFHKDYAFILSRQLVALALSFRKWCRGRSLLELQQAVQLKLSN